MSDRLHHPARPCSECPWRRDQPAGRFPAERYVSLRGTCRDETRGGTAPIGAPLFACHKTLPGNDSACAGWLAVEGLSNVQVRLALVQGRLKPDALKPGEGWPELYGTYEQLAEANGVEGE